MKCHINEEQQRLVRQFVASSLFKAIEAEGDFSIESGVKPLARQLYNAIKEQYQDEELALDHARLVPIYAGQLMQADLQLGGALLNMGVDPTSLLKLNLTLTDDVSGLKSIQDFIALEEDLGKDLQDLNQNPQMTFDFGEDVNDDTDGAADATPTNSVEKRVVSDDAFNPIAATPMSDELWGEWNEAISGDPNSPDYNVPKENLKLHFKVKRELISDIKAGQDSSQLDEPVYLTAMRLDNRKLRGYRRPGDENLSDDTVMLVLTDAGDNPISWNEDAQQTDADSGTVLYYPMRPSEFTLDDKGVPVFPKETKGYHSYMIRGLAERKKIDRTKAAKAYAIRLQQLKNITDYIKANPGRSVQNVITGGNKGVLIRDYNIKTPIKDINFGDQQFIPGYSMESKSGQGAGVGYFTLNDIHGHLIQIERPTMGETKYLDKILDLLTEDVYDEAGRPLATTQVPLLDTYGNKTGTVIALDPILKNFLELSKESIQISTKGGARTVKIRGELVDLTNKAEARKQLRQFLTGLHTFSRKYIKPTDGKTVEEQVEDLVSRGYVVHRGSIGATAKMNDLLLAEDGKYYRLDKIKLHISKTESFVDLDLQTDAQGRLTLDTSKTKNWVQDYIRENFYINYPLNAEGKLVKLNAYMQYKTAPEDAKRIKPSALKDSEGVNRQKVMEQSARKENESTKDYVNRLIDSGFLKGIEGKYVFEIAAGRAGIVVDVNGVSIPFYQSTGGTSGKKKDAWYPFFGTETGWVIKGDDAMERGYDVPAIKEMMDFLTENFSRNNALNEFLGEEYSQNRKDLGRLDESLFKGDQRISNNVLESRRRLASILGYDVDTAAKLTGYKKFQYASKNVFDKFESGDPSAKAKAGLQDRMTKKLPEIASPTAKKHVPKELVKTKMATQYIGDGSANSSTDRYRKMYAEEGVANTGNYNSSDVVYVSSNGKRSGRVNPVKDGKLQGEYKNVQKAMDAGATIVMDTKAHLEKTKAYNIGELALAEYLENNGYKREGESGVWKPTAPVTAAVSDAVKDAPKPSSLSSAPKRKKPRKKFDDTKNDPDLLFKLDAQHRVDATAKQIEEAKAWYDSHPMLAEIRKHIPFETMFDVVNTKNNGARATWSQAGITLYKAADYSDLYHEAFHAFTQMFMSPEQKSALYNETRNKSGSFTDHTGRRVTFKNATDAQLEEYLAEDFRVYMLKGKPKKNAPARNNIFQWLLNALKSLFENSSYSSVIQNDAADAKIHAIYENLRVGNLSEYSFSQENAADVGELNSTIQSWDPTEAISKLSHTQSSKLVNSVDSLLAEFADNMNRGEGITEEQLERITFLENETSKRALTDEQEKDQEKYQEELDNLRELQGEGSSYMYTTAILKNKDLLLKGYKYVHKRLQEQYGHLADRLEQETNAEVIASISKDMETLDWAINNFGSVENLEFNFFEGNEDVKGVIGYHIRKSNRFMSDVAKLGFEEKVDFEDMTEDETFLKDLSGIDRKGNETSLQDLAAKEVLYLLKGINKVNDDGTPAKNSFGIKELIEFQEIWNRIARLTEGTMSIEKMEKLLNAEKENYPPFKQLLSRLGPVSPKSDRKLELPQVALWTKFWQTFNKTRIPLIQMTLERKEDETGVSEMSRIGEAFRPNRNIKSVWESRFVEALPGSSKYIGTDDKGNFLNLDAVLKDFPTVESVTDDPYKFFKAIGIDLSDNKPIREALNKGVVGSSYFRNKIEWLRDNKKQVRNLFDLTRSYRPKDDLSTAVEGSLKPQFDKLVELEGLYTADYNNYMVTNAEGNTQFEHSLNSSMTAMVNAINSAESYQELKDMPHMSHLDLARNPGAKASTLLNSVFQLDVDSKSSNYGKPRFKRDGTRVQLKMVNLSGVLLDLKGETSISKGIASAKADMHTKMILDLHLSAQRGIYEQMRHSDKSTSFALVPDTVMPANGTEVRTGYINQSRFYNTSYHTKAVELILPHLAAELERMSRLRNVKDPSKFDYRYWNQGQDFVAFKDVLSDELRLELEGMISDKQKDPDDKTLRVNEILQALEQDKDLANRISDELKDYFDEKFEETLDDFNEAAYIAPNLMQEQLNANKGVSRYEVRKALVKGMVYNSWIHNIESAALIYGDIAQYNHAKEGFHKRNAGVASTGTIYRTDKSMQAVINHVDEGVKSFGNRYARSIGAKEHDFNGQFNTAIIQDNEIGSAYYGEYKDALLKAGYSEANVNPYNKGKMNEGDAQAFITFDAYRTLKFTEGSWTGKQEELYRKIVNKEEVDPSEVSEFFPVIKAQYWGPLANKDVAEGLPMTAFHKYSLFPMIPTAIKGTNLQKLHDKMVRENTHYLTFDSGSKVATVTNNAKGTRDAFYADGKRKLLSDEPFTHNTIFLEYLKNQLEVAPTYKGKVIFSTQLRKLIEDGLMENGIPSDFQADVEDINARRAAWDKIGKGKTSQEREELKRKASPNYAMVKVYENHLKRLTEVKKEALIREAGWDATMKDGKLVDFKGDLGNLMKFVKSQLSTREIADHALDFIQVVDGKLKHSLDLSLYAGEIDKVLNAIVTKRLVKQKVNGEALIQVSGALFENLDSVGRDYEKASTQDLEKWGTNDLPTYTSKVNLAGRYDGFSKEQLKEQLALKKGFKKDQARYWTLGWRNALDQEISYLEAVSEGKKPPFTEIDTPTKPMKVKIALQGKFLNLLHMKHPDGEKIGTRERLNALVKDEAWMAENKDLVTMVGVRIPVQGLNSMEFMEVYEFLPIEAGNIIVPPAEIVAKSGADFDVDKMTVMMPTINKRVNRAKINNALIKQIKEDYKEEFEDSQYLREFTMDDLRLAMEGSKSGGVYTLSEDEQYLLDILSDYAEVDVIYDTSESTENGLQNLLIQDVKNILELPQNFAPLVRPNSTDMFLNDEGTGLAQEVGDLTKEYDPNANRFGSRNKKGITGTRVFEYKYNLNKHGNNNIGKATLGLGAVDNTYNTILTRIGAYLNPTNDGLSAADIRALRLKLENDRSLSSFDKQAIKDQINNHRRQKLFLSHNQLESDGKKVVSISHIKDAEGNNSISDVINQMINGWVDIAGEEPWIFHIQGNKEVAPTLLFMIQAGVPLDQAVYFASMPLVREYVKHQRLAKSTLAESLRTAHPMDSSYYKAEAKHRMFENYVDVFATVFGMDPKLTEHGRHKSPTLQFARGAERAVNENFKKEDLLERLKDHKAFMARQEKAEKDLRKARKQNNTAAMEKAQNILNEIWEPNYKDFTAFLHYLEVEDMANVVRDVKMRMNFDTSKADSFQTAQNMITLKDELSKKPSLSAGLVDDIIENSPIGSFYIQKFQLKLWDKLFKLRNHPFITQYLSTFARDKQSSLVEKTFQDPEKTANEFKNDFLNYIFQKELRDFNPTGDYKGYTSATALYDLRAEYQNLDLSNKADQARAEVIKKKAHEITGTPVSRVTSLLQGASPGIKKADNGAYVTEDVIYYDKAQMDKEFANKDYQSKVYTDKGLARLEHTIKFHDKKEYYHFVFEREHLRNIEPFETVRESVEFKQLRHRLTLKLEGKGYTPEQVDKWTYESFLRDKALDNIFNHTKLFHSTDSTFADQLVRLKASYPELEKDYPILKNLISSIHMDPKTKAVKGKNIKIQNTAMDLLTTNTFHENLLRLMDPTVKKVQDPADNKRITDFFRRLPVVAVLQSGLDTKTSYSLIKIIPQRVYLSMMEKPYLEMGKHLDIAATEGKGTPLLIEFRDQFEKQNARNNRAGRIRGRAYYSNISYDQANEVAKTGIPIPKEKRVDPREELLFGLEAEGVSEYTEPYDGYSTKAIQKITKDNLDKTYVYNGTLNPDSKPSSTARDGLFKNADTSNTAGLPILKNFGFTKANQISDTPQGTVDSDVKAAIDKAIDFLVAEKERGQEIVFNRDGYGLYMIGGFNQWREVTKEDYESLQKLMPQRNLKAEEGVEKMRYRNNKKETYTTTVYSVKGLHHGDTAVAPQTFLYLSDRLYEEFGYINPGYSRTPEGQANIQDLQVPAISDEMVKDFMNQCFNL